ncbi:MAG: hypothetical protein GTO02_14770 [Candidatus Dadabacteria bacterium]|nr:hypothetical protein [Candidatus Dadabacteria bacterium]
MITYREWEANNQQLLNEKTPFMQAFQTAKSAGRLSAGVSNTLTQAIYNLAQHPRGEVLLRRIYRWIIGGIQRDQEMTPEDKQALIDQFPAVGRAINLLKRGGERLGIGQQATGGGTAAQQPQVR